MKRTSPGQVGLRNVLAFLGPVFSSIDVVIRNYLILITKQIDEKIGPRKASTFRRPTCPGDVRTMYTSRPDSRTCPGRPPPLQAQDLVPQPHLPATTSVAAAIGDRLPVADVQRAVDAVRLAGLRVLGRDRMAPVWRQ